MAVPSLITTPGAANANSYCSIAEADDYFDTHLYGGTWSDADNETQARALLIATRLLDEHMNWNGFKFTALQSLRFPQSGLVDRDGFVVDHLTIPKALINATAEFAKCLIDEDRTAEPDTKGFSRMRAGDLELYIDKIDQKKVIPDSVISLISFLGTPKSFKSNKLTRC